MRRQVRSTTPAPPPDRAIIGHAARVIVGLDAGMQGLSAKEIDQQVTALRFADSETEAGYRAWFLQQDRRDAIIAIAVFVFFKASFSVFDLMFQTPDRKSTRLNSSH